MANEPSEQEKLEKLLRMAGFTKCKYPSAFTGVYPWRTPEGEDYYDYKLKQPFPDLLHSLDDQEEWLVPMLWEKGFYIELEIQDKCKASIWNANYSLTITRDKLSEAFAEAVLKLMEDEK